MYSTRALTTAYYPVNMRGRGLRVYRGGQRGNGIGGIFKPILTRAVVPLAKRVVVPLAKKALKSVGKRVMKYATSKAAQWVEKKTGTKRKTAQQRGKGLKKRRKVPAKGIKRKRSDIFTYYH